MILTEDHFIKKNKKTKALYDRIDGFCYRTKNLHNAVNYRITQCRRISRKISQNEKLEDWEKELLTETNQAIGAYNRSRPGKKELKPVDADNGFIADAYFLSWFLKDTEVYKEVSYATCSQICIQELCRDWKSYYQGLKQWKKKPSVFTGIPHKPGYLDKIRGRSPLFLTRQNVRIDEYGNLRMPKFLNGLEVRIRHGSLHQVRIQTEPEGIRIQIMYDEACKKAIPKDKSLEKQCFLPEGNPSATCKVMAIDPGINNLMAICMDQGSSPVIIPGKPLKSVNQYYNKKKASLQSKAKKENRKNTSNRMEKLTRKRNRKVKDYMHKATRMVIRLAMEEGIGSIIIGKNKGWKKEVSMGNITNQNFVSIPYTMMIKMLRYKAELEGLQVIEIEESYTSGTSWLDNETPSKENYDKKRRVHRGLFISNTGKAINADVNAAYQILRKAGYGETIPKKVEEIRIMKAS